jgi:hypothetical protein
MALVALVGLPVVAYASLTSGAPGPVALSLVTVEGQAAYTLQPAERLYITALSVSTNDATQRLATLDTGGPTPTKLASMYMVSPGPTSNVTENFAPGTVRGIAGVVPRASAPAVTNPKTIEMVATGYVART